MSSDGKIIQLKQATTQDIAKKKKKLRKPSNLLAVLLITLTCVFMLTVAKKVVACRITDISISGEAYENNREVMDEICSGINGRLYFDTDVDELAESFRINGYVNVKECRKEFPDKLIVQLDKRIPMAQIEFDGLWLFIDNEGYVIDVLKSAGKEYLTITGAAVQSFSVGEKVSFNSDYRYDGLLDVMNALDSFNLLGKINEISIYDYFDYKLVTESGNVIHLGIDDRLEEKLTWLQSDRVWQLMQENSVTELDLRPESPVLRWPEVPETEEQEPAEGEY